MGNSKIVEARVLRIAPRFHLKRTVLAYPLVTDRLQFSGRSAASAHGSDFSIGGPLTEIAPRFAGIKLVWDASWSKCAFYA
jgi:hypothetical protein